MFHSSVAGLFLGLCSLQVIVSWSTLQIRRTLLQANGLCCRLDKALKVAGGKSRVILQVLQIHVSYS